MPTRKRIRTFIPNISGGGGGGPSPGGTINWGPSFGQNPGNDASTWNTSVAVAMPSLALRGGTTANAAVAMPSLGLTGGTTASATLGGSVLGAPFWQSVETAANSAASISITVNKPANVAQNDLMLAFVGQKGVGTKNIDPPPGWRRINTASIGAIRAAAFYKLAEAVEPANYTFTSSLSAVPFQAEIHHIIANARGSTPDSSSNDRPLFIVGAPSVVASPWAGFGSAIDFNGVDTNVTSQRLEARDAADLSGSFVFECKARPDSNSATAVILAAQNYVAQGNSVPNRGAIVYIDGADGFYKMAVYSNGANQVASSGITATPGIKADLAIVGDGSVFRLYIDGSLSATITPTLLLTSDQYISVGGLHYGPSSASPFPFDGVIDEVRLSVGTTRGYIGGYTPATTPFADDAQTWGLWHMDSISGQAAVNAEAVATLAATSLDPDPDTPSVVTTADNTLVFSYIYHDHLTLPQTHAPPASHIEVTDFESTGVASITANNTAWRVFSSPGATGTAAHNCTETVATDAVMMRVAIAPGSLTIA